MTSVGGSLAFGGLSPLGVRMVVEGFNDFIKKQKAANKAVGNTSKGLKDVERDSKKTGGAFGKLTKQVALVAGGFLAAQAVIRGFRAAISGTIGAAIEFESTFAGVRKTVDGSDAELQALSSTIRRMALDIPLSTSALNSLAETAGQLGIRGTNNVAQFVEVIAKLGATTNLVGAQGATVLARFMNIMGTAQGRVKELAGVLVDLGNNSATTEAEIASMALRIAGTGAVVGLSEADVLGLAAALSSLGLAADVGGSSISRTLQTIAQAVQEGGRELEVFAETAGITVQEFSGLFERDAVQALQAFIVGLDGINTAGGNVFATLDELGLADIRVSRALLSAAQGSDTFTEALGRARAAAAESGAALDTEFNRRMETTAARAELAKNAISEIGIEIGTNFLAAISGAADALANIAREAAVTRERTDALTASYLEAAEAAGILKDAQGDTTESVLEQNIALVEAFDRLADWERQIIATRISQGKYGVALGETERAVRDFRQEVFEQTGELISGEDALTSLEFNLRVIIAREIEAGQATSELTEATEEQTEAVVEQAQAYKPLTDEIADLIVANRDLDRGLGPLAADMDAVAISADIAARSTAILAGEVERFARLQAALGQTKAEERAERFSEGVERFLGDTSGSGGLSQTDIRRLAEAGGGGGGGGAVGLTPEEIAAAQSQFEQWAPLFEEVLRTQEDLDEALAEDFVLRTAIADLEEERLGITNQILALRSDETTFAEEILRLEGERERISDRIAEIRRSEFETEQALLDIQQQRKDVLQGIANISAPQVAEIERITDRQRLLDLAKAELELAVLQAESREEDTTELEDQLATLEEGQALERETLGVEMDLARLRVEGIEDAHEEQLAAIASETELRKAEFDTERQAREDEIAGLQEDLRLVAERIELQEAGRQKAIDALAEQRELLDDQIETAEEALETEIERREEIVQAAKDALAIEQAISDIVALREENSLGALKRMIELQEQLNRLRDQPVGTVVAVPPVAMAEGGEFAAGQALMVGERGPEMAVFGQGGRILSNLMVSQMVSAVHGLTRATAGMATMPGTGGTQIVPIPIEKTVFNLDATYSSPQPEASLFRDLTTMQTLRRGR